MRGLTLDSSVSEAFSSAERWLTPREVAERLQVSVGHVYRHWPELGGRKLGDGRNAPVRFPPEALLAATACTSGRESEDAETLETSAIPPRREGRHHQPVPEWVPLRIRRHG